MSGRFRRWGMIAFVVFAGFICRENTAQAAMAQISLQKSADEIVKSDIFYVVITVAADEEITGFDGYFSYDQDIMQYITGGSVSSGNDDEIHVKDLDRETGTKKIKYSLQFRARKAGSCTVALKKCRKIQTADGSAKMSIGSASLGIQVLSRKEYKARHTEAPFPADASDNPESPASDTDESIQTGDIGEDEPTAEAAGTQEPPDQGITSETGMATGQLDQGMMQENSSTTEPPAATASALPGDARNTQGFPGLTKGICIVILCLALAGFVMVMILLRSALKPVDDWGEDMEDDSTVESEPEEDIPEETELSMEEIEKRLEEKRRWLRKE
ncbi:hypothetical protein [Jutongia sp.]